MMKKLLITGCGGQLGRALNKEYESEQVEIINTDVPEVDITDLEAVLNLVDEKKPDVIINCGALTAVDLCESEYDKAFRINAIGPRNLGIAAGRAGAKLFQISTDYVFSGEADRPYVETDQPDPQNVYGSTKLAGCAGVCRPLFYHPDGMAVRRRQKFCRYDAAPCPVS